MEKKAVIYARQSCGLEENSLSVETQIEMCQNYCREHRLKVKGVYQDSNTSGRTFPTCFRDKAETDQAFMDWFATQTRSKMYREGLSNALTSLERGDVIVVDEPTRLCRSVEGSHLASDITYFLNKLGVFIHSVKGKVIDPSSAMDRLFQTITSQVNNEQIENGVRKSLETRHRMQNEGIWITDFKANGLVSLGDHRYRIDPRYMPCIQDIFEGVLAGLTYSSITRQINRKYGDLFVKAFYSSTFYNMVKQPLYAGYMRDTRGDLIRCTGLTGEPAVSISNWHKAQHVLETKRTAPVRGIRGENILPFSQKLVCGNCGSVLSIVRDKTRTIYYACLVGSNLHQNTDCSRSRVRISDPANDKYIGLRHALCPLLVLGQYSVCLESQANDETVKKQQDVQAKIDRILAKIPAIELGIIEGTYDEEGAQRSIADLNRKLKELRAVDCKLRARLETNHRKMMFEDPIWGNFQAILENKISDATYKNLMGRILKRVVCYEDRVDVETNYGTFTLDRYLDRKARCFPKFTWRIVRDNRETPKDISKCKLEITYHYCDGRDYQILIDFPVMKIIAND